MATRTSLYSYKNNIIEIAIGIDATGDICDPDTPLTSMKIKIDNNGVFPILQPIF
jgi:hypothetical protein